MEAAVSLLSMLVLCCQGFKEWQKWLMPFSFALGAWKMDRDWTMGRGWGSPWPGRWEGTWQDIAWDGGFPWRSTGVCRGSLGPQSVSLWAPARSRTASVLGTGDRDRTEFQPWVGRQHKGPWASSTGTDRPQGAKRVSCAMAVTREPWRAGQGQGGLSVPSALTVSSRGKPWYQPCHGRRAENCDQVLHKCVQLQQNPQDKCPRRWAEAALHLIPQLVPAHHHRGCSLGWTQRAELAPWHWQRSAGGWTRGALSPRDRGDKVGAGHEHKPLESTWGWKGRCFWRVNVCCMWQPLAARLFWITFLDFTAYISSNFHFRHQVGALELIFQSSLHNRAPKKGSDNTQNPPTCWEVALNMCFRVFGYFEHKSKLLFCVFSIVATHLKVTKWTLTERNLSLWLKNL